MSEESQRPLSRRELRLREGWVAEDANLESETSAVASSDTGAVIVPETSPFSDAHPTTTSSIPVVGPDGQLMSRRQLRELWAAEEAAAAAEAQAAIAATEAQSTEAQAETEAPAAERAIAPVLAESVAVEAAAAPDNASTVEPLDMTEPPSGTEPEPDFLAVIDTEGHVQQDVAEEPPADTDTQTELPTDEQPPGEPSFVEEPPRKLRFPWARKPADPQPEDAPPADNAVEPSSDTVASAPEQLAGSSGLSDQEPGTVVESVLDDVPGAESLEAVEAEAVVAVELDADETVEPTAAQELAAEPDASQQDEATPPVEPYTFPEVSPEPEARSIFDRPDFMQSQTGSVQQTESGGAFDDIIERAVADEGAASPTTTAALILPVMPDTTDLSGALNETGEIVITGSIELPKVLGETGGHQSLHESIEVHEAVVMGHDVHELTLNPEPDGQPVAASKAISAQGSSAALIGSQPERRGKLPLVLAITAGSLTVIVAGVFVWAASTGLFG